MPAIVTHNIACPACRDAGTSTMNPLKTKHGDSMYFCDAGHRFPDREELMARKPAMLRYTPPAAKPIQGAVKFTVDMPPKLLGVLQSRFGTKLDAAARFWLESLVEDGSFVVNNVSAEQLGAHFGKKPDNAQKLIGMVFSMKEDLKNAREEFKQATGDGPKPAAGTAAWLGLDFEPDVMVTLRAKAKEQRLSLRGYLEQIILGALEKGWI